MLSANEVFVQDLELKGNVNPVTGASVGIFCRGNAAVQLLRINIAGFLTGAFADGGGHCGLTDSIISNNLLGARVRNNGTLHLINLQIDNYRHGLFSERGGYITIIDSSVSAFPAINPASNGMVSRSGGSIRSIRTTIKDNGTGLRIENFGMVSFNQGTISDNTEDAIKCTGVFDLRGLGGVTFNNNGGPTPDNLCP